MKILHIIPSLDMNKGGPSRSVIGMVRAQADLGADVKIVAGWDVMKPDLALDNVKMEFGRLARCRFGVPSPDLAKRIRKNINYADFVHLHSIWTGTISYAAWRCRVEGKPTILSPRGMLDSHNMHSRKYLKSFWFKMIERANIASLAGFHFQDQTERDGCSWLDESIDKPYLVQPNGLDVLDLSVRLSNCESSGYPNKLNHEQNDKTNLVYLGRLHPIKGLDMQVELLADLRNVGINAHLYMIGPDDGVSGSIVALAVRLGVEPFIHLLGANYNDDRLQWLKEADVVLLTSHYECNSNTATEAMAVGGVLVATDTCHVDRPAQVGAVCVVPRERGRLFNAVRELVTVPGKALHFRKAASDYAVQHLDWKVHAREMLEFYDKFI